MKTLFLLLSTFLIFNYAKAQNTFPTSGGVGLGTLNPAYALDISADYPVIRLVSNANQPSFAIRGNNSTWIMGTNGQPGQEDISIGAQDGSGQRTLTFAAGGGARMKILSGGNIGIGTTSPSTKLEVNGETTISHTLFVKSNNINSGEIVLYKPNSNYYDIVSNNNNFQVYNSENNSFVLSSDRNDNLGIGTTDTKGYKLAVNGSLVATSITVKSFNSWPDYVFKKGYNLPELSEVKSYIDKNHHLEEIPSAVQMEKNGIDLGEMNIKLLKKVEELTLYLIEKDKEDKILQGEMIALKRRIKHLESNKW